MLQQFKDNKRRFLQKALEIGFSLESSADQNDELSIAIEKFNRFDADIRKVEQQIQDLSASLKTSFEILGQSSRSLFDLQERNPDIVIPDINNAAISFVQTSMAIESILVSATNAVTKNDVLGTTTRLTTEAFPYLREKMEDREKLILDYDSHKRKLKTANPSDIERCSKLTSKVENDKQKLDEINAFLLGAFNELEDSRATILHQESAALIRTTSFLLREAATALEETLTTYKDVGITIEEVDEHLCMAMEQAEAGIPPVLNNTPKIKISSPTKKIKFADEESIKNSSPSRKNSSKPTLVVATDSSPSMSTLHKFHTKSPSSIPNSPINNSSSQKSNFFDPSPKNNKSLTELEKSISTLKITLKKSSFKSKSPPGSRKHSRTVSTDLFLEKKVESPSASSSSTMTSAPPPPPVPEKIEKAMTPPPRPPPPTNFKR